MIASNDETKRVHDGKRKKMKKSVEKGGEGAQRNGGEKQYMEHDRQKDTKWNEVHIERNDTQYRRIEKDTDTEGYTIQEI